MTQVLEQGLLEGSIHQEQLKIEEEMSGRGVARYLKARTRAEGKGDAALLKPAERVLRHWFQPLMVTIQSKQKHINAKKGQYTGRAQYAVPILLGLDADLLAAVTIRDTLGELLNPRTPQRVPLYKLCYAIGRSCIAEINMDRLSREDEEMHKMLTAWMRRFDPTRVNFWANKSLGKPLTYRKTCIAAGAMLLSLLIESAHAGDYDEDVWEPAFRIEMDRTAKRQTQVVVMASKVYKLIEDGHELRKMCRPHYAPMVVAPAPWTRDLDGGYVRARFPLVSRARGPQRTKIKEYRKAGRMDRLLEAHAYLDATAWSINQRIVDVQRQVWDKGGDPSLGIPNVAKEPLPPRPLDWEKATEEERTAYKREARRVYSRNAELAGLKTQFLMALSEAEKFSEYGRVYMPHKLDFRGRMYPTPWLNHQQSDPIRALFQFANPVSGDGTRWLLIHAANCFGVDKVSFDDRAKWASDHAEDIILSASRPMEVEFWRHADSPWQFLAACFALDDPKVGQRLPVQMDGSCNGLQHLSAMTRDENMAAPVNLIDGPVPGDVYSFVADEARKPAMASRPDLVQYLTRPLVKRPVMTSVYGLTPYSARKYVFESLREAGVSKDDAREYCDPLRSFIEQGMMGACRGAEQAMDWLSMVGGILARRGHLSEWEHPLGLPVVNPHINTRKSQVKTLLGNITVYDYDVKQPMPLASKQRNGMSPNFVHTLDAAHLQMTALRMKAEGKAMGGVHDSYWTHAADVDVMSRVLREEFASLHSIPRLDMHYERVKAEHPELQFPEPPRLGTLDVGAVVESTYFFH